jgi:hypothetical protein
MDSDYSTDIRSIDFETNKMIVEIHYSKNEEELIVVEEIMME